MPKKPPVQMIEVGYALTLPLPPTANHRTRNAIATVKDGPTQGKRYTRQIRTNVALAYEIEVQWIAKRAGVWPVDGPVELWLEVYRPANRGDWDAWSKVVCDALEGFLWDNDAQIWRGHVTLFVDKANPRIGVRMVGMSSRHAVEVFR